MPAAAVATKAAVKISGVESSVRRTLQPHESALLLSNAEVRVFER